MSTITDIRIWQEVLKKLDKGVTQGELAKEMGLTRGQFRYRLRKFLEMKKETEVEMVATLSTDLDQKSAVLQEPTIWDERWLRKRDRNRLVIMSKDPTTLFVYWEMKETRKQIICEHFQSDWHYLPLFLQCYDVTSLWFNGTYANEIRRVQVHPEDDHWYFNYLTPGHNYLVDFGTTTLTGHFFTILRSNIVELSRLDLIPQDHPTIRFDPLHSVSPSNIHPLSRETSLDHETWNHQFNGYTLTDKENG